MSRNKFRVYHGKAELVAHCFLNMSKPEYTNYRKYYEKKVKVNMSMQDLKELLQYAEALNLMDKPFMEVYKMW